MASLQGKVIAITGAASGIGLATAKVCWARGASLAICDIQKEVLEQAAESIKSTHSSEDQKLTSAVVDVTATDAVNSWINDVVTGFGKLDGAANIAGVARAGTLLVDTTDEDWDMVLNVNSTAVFKCLRAELSHMKSGSAVVNISSVGGLMGSPGMTAYCASKHAVVGLTKTAAKEVGSRGIRVNAVAPGVIETPMIFAARDRGDELSAAHTPLGRNGDPKEVASVIAFLLSDDASYMTGHIVNVEGGWLS